MNKALLNLTGILMLTLSALGGFKAQAQKTDDQEHFVFLDIDTLEVGNGSSPVTYCCVVNPDLKDESY